MPPFLICNHLHPDPSAQPLLLVDGTRVIEPDPPLIAVRGTFTSDGEGGLIAAALSTSGFGYIDASGRWVVAPTLQDARAFIGDGVARFQAGDLWGYLDLRGKIVIEPQFEEAGTFQRGRAPVRNGKYWRYIDKSGALAFEGTFTRANTFSACGLALAKPSGEARYGYIDEAGNWAIAPQFSHALGFTRDGVAPAQLKDNRMGVIDMHGQWVVKPAYSDVHAFANGYAYCRVDRYAQYPQGCYIDTSGRIVIPLQERLAEWMADGWAKSGEWEYVGLDGELAVSADIRWGTHFTGHGFAIAGGFVKNAAGRAGGDMYWGILGADGTFHQAPDDALEPLTDDDADIVFPEPDTPLVPFVTRNEDVALLDREGRIVYRMQRETADGGERAVLRDAQGAVLWSSALHPSVARVRPFFGGATDRFLHEIEDCAQLPELADGLLQRTEERLALLVHGELTDDEDEDEDDDDVGSAANSARTAQRVWRAYLTEHAWGTYDFLDHLRNEQMEAMHARMVTALTERFGQPSTMPEHTRSAYGVSGPVWAVGTESQRYWVGISKFCDSGDGDGWYEIWLHCIPGIETVEAAMADAPARPDRDDEDDEPDDDDEAQPAAPKPRTRDEWMAQVGGYEGWLAEVCAHGYRLRAVPAEFLDDAMVDAVLDANLGNFDYVPAAFLTPARLEAVIRKGPGIAAHIPPAYMTAEGLALARSLYIDEVEWNLNDLRKTPLADDPLDLDSMREVWGCYVDADLALRAVQSGVSLREIPHWLRNDALVEAALKSNIDNVIWADRGQVTAEMAARAVQREYSDLLEHIPRALLTPDLCLTAVTVSGRSLEFVPAEFMTVPLCLAAVRASDEALDFVPDALRDAVLAALETGE